MQCHSYPFAVKSWNRAQYTRKEEKVLQTLHLVVGAMLWCCSCPMLSFACALPSFRFQYVWAASERFSSMTLRLGTCSVPCRHSLALLEMHYTERPKATAMAIGRDTRVTGIVVSLGGTINAQVYRCSGVLLLVATQPPSSGKRPDEWS